MEAVSSPEMLEINIILIFIHSTTLPIGFFIHRQDSTVHNVSAGLPGVTRYS